MAKEARPTDGEQPASRKGLAGGRHDRVRSVARAPKRAKPQRRQGRTEKEERRGEAGGRRDRRSQRREGTRQPWPTRPADGEGLAEEHDHR
jgi:hypothetical protein